MKIWGHQKKSATNAPIDTILFSEYIYIDCIVKQIVPKAVFKQGHHIPVNW